MDVKQLWRYPVKSMRGEALVTAEVTTEGIVGDRVVHVENDHGPVTARRRPALLGLSGSTRPDGQVLVDGRPWQDPAVGEQVRAAAGTDTRLVRDEGLDRFDILPLLVATDGAIQAFGRDGRRLRPNLVVGGVDGLAECAWEGCVLAIGPVLLHLDSLRQRCVMTTYDPDTLERDGEVLRDINRRFAGTLALNTAVLRPGVLRVGDEVRLLARQEAGDLLWASLG
jgi:uncharacterized protein